MTQSQRHRGWTLRLAIAGAVAQFSSGIFFSTNDALAQPVPDNTLGSESSVITPDVVNGLPSDRIDGGAIRGSNLFHSFREFGINENRGAYFANPAGIENILSRVTGNSRSEILGRLGVLGNANLFLINPNGIVFGPNARLDVNGSFVVSTADRFTFPNSSEFSAVNPQTPPLLAVNVAPGLQYGSTAATIANRGTLSAGQDLTLAAGNLDVQGALQAGRNLTLQAQDTVQVRDTATTPLIAAAGGRLQVQGSTVDIFALNHPNSGFWSGGDLVLRSGNAAIGDAHFHAGGNFRVEQPDGSPGNLLSPNDPIILTLGDVTLGDYTGASLHILAGGSVTLGTVTITGTGNTATTINPNNTRLFNGSRSYADLASFNLTEYRATLNSDGTVRSVDPVLVPITIDGSQQPTVDIRAGVDWAQLGGLPTSPVLAGTVTPAPNLTGTAVRADITLNGKVLNSSRFSLVQGIRIAQPEGLVLLTNQFSPNILPGTIVIQGDVNTSTRVPERNGGDIRVYGRGDITIAPPVPSGSILLNSSSSSSSGTAGNGGAISFSSNLGNISLTNSNSNSSSDSDSRSSLGTAGNGGAISFSSNSGNISLTSSNSNSSSFSSSGTAGNGGAISFSSNLGNISLLNSDSDSNSSSVSGTGGNGGAISFSSNSGNISLLNSDSDSNSSSRTGTAGTGGPIRLSARSGTISGRDSVLNSFAVSQQGGSGNGGKVTLEAGSEVSGLTVNTVASNGLAGDVEVNGFDNLRVANTRILTAQQVEVCPLGSCPPNRPVQINLVDRGQAGDVTVTSTGSLTFSNSVIESDTRGGNPAGNITFQANGGIEITDGSTISARTSSGGRAGSIRFNAPTLAVAGNAQVLAETSSSGAGGSIFVNAPTAVDLRRVNDFSPVLSVQTSGAGRSGDIVVNTQTLTLSDRARITATATATATNLQGGGSITLNASTMNLAGIVGVFAETQGQAPAGTLRLNPYNNQPDLNVTLAPSSQISASTSGSGNGGDLIIQAPRSIALSGPGKLAVETTNSGNAGDINISTGKLSLTNGVQVSASTSASATGQAGNIVVNTGTLLLDRGTLLASTASGEGGNLNLTISNLVLLRNGSLISAQAGGTGNGGNIAIDTPAGFIVAVPNQDSDIIANAFQGEGGRIQITAQSIFGIEERRAIRSNGTNDIDASSEFGTDGVVENNTPDVDPNRGLVALPTEPVETEVAQGCQTTGNQASSRFVITGRGGLPPNPSDALSGDAVAVDLVTLSPTVGNSSNPTVSAPPTQPAPQEIVEAQGWIIDSNREVILVAQAPATTPDRPQLTAVNCSKSHLKFQR